MTPSQIQLMLEIQTSSMPIIKGPALRTLAALRGAGFVHERTIKQNGVLALMSKTVDRTMQHYWIAMRGLQSAKSDGTLDRYIRGHLSLALRLEKDVKLRRRLLAALSQSPVD